jgi:hypothetical protein
VAARPLRPSACLLRGPIAQNDLKRDPELETVTLKVLDITSIALTFEEGVDDQ